MLPKSRVWATARKYLQKEGCVGEVRFSFPSITVNQMSLNHWAGRGSKKKLFWLRYKVYVSVAYHKMLNECN